MKIYAPMKPGKPGMTKVCKKCGKAKCACKGKGC